MISTHFIAEQQEELDHKIAEVEMIKDQLTLMDVRIDRYDSIISNIDKQIIPLIDEINVAITSVKTAYDNRIASKCKNNLYWEQIGAETYTWFGIDFYNTIYQCKKNPNVRTDYGYYGAKYYRKPQNQDYGANIVKEFLGTISSGSTSLAVLGVDGTSNLLVGDNITDNIDNPTIFPIDLPTIVGFGTTSITGVTTDFGGSVSSGSTIIVSTGIGTTGNVNVGDTITLSDVLAPNTKVAGIGTTTATQTVWNPGLGTTTVLTTQTTAGQTVGIGSTVVFVNSVSGVSAGSSLSITGKLTNVPIVSVGDTFVRIGTANTIGSTIGPGLAATFRTFNGFISTSVSVSSLIVSIPAVGTGTGTFKVGPLVTYPALILSGPAQIDGNNINFTDIRTTQTSSTVFDYSNNPIDPVTIGIMGSGTIGLGHKLVRVNNGSPIGPFQWHEIMTADFASKSDSELNDTEKYLRTTYPEPACGASYAEYYPGDTSWPIKYNYFYSEFGIKIDSLTTSSYAQEGDKLIVGFGNTIPFGKGTTSTKPPGAASDTDCTNIYDAAITAAEASRDAILERNLPKIDSLINAVTPLRDMRDTMESRAFGLLQGRVHGDTEINKLRDNLAILHAADYTPFEPPVYYFDATTGKLVSSQVGVGTT